MKYKFLILCCFAVQISLAQTWLPSTSSVTFKTKMLGVSVDGSLKGMRTSLKFANNEPISLSATVDSKSVNTSNSLRDKHLSEKEEFFQPDIYPNIAMSSISIEKVSEGKYTGVFKLTIKSVTKNVKIPFTFTEENNKAQLKSSFSIDRNDWGFGGNTPGMSDNVKISILLNLTKS
ncbi:YceI family protein [Lacihabitans sp. LS3-19]|uniref:YceI family protein n=1 Tax=Lacihabitans sp. LS3-19 TaxID=2487335 RepID=UPI0020CE90E9|nr:YceI family protein [Lacihabitans sp. LS3-19]MCP9770190.1 YceI family protein [Lacihabitans sp. LS3-19]